jgi:hypothetical protein
LQHFASIQKLRSPVLKLRRLAFGEPEAGLLRGELAATAAPRVIGHNALLEVMHCDSASSAHGSRVLVFPRTPCGDEGCALCAGAARSALTAADVRGVSVRCRRNT